MRHFTDALFESLEENTLATLAELEKLLPAYLVDVDNALRNGKHIEYNAEPKLDMSSYILPSGVLINGPREGHLEIRACALYGLPEQIRNKVYNDDYAEAELYLDQMFENESSLLDYVYKNVIRLNSASDNTYILIDTSRQLLTGQQLSKLEDWLDLVLYANKAVDLSIYCSNSSLAEFRGTLTLDNYDSRDVINLVKYVQTNKRPPSTAVWEALEK
jgi:hypothetical protein